MATRDDELFALLTLLSTPGLGPRIIGRLREACGSYAEVLALGPAMLERVPGIGQVRARELTSGRSDAKKAAEKEIDRTRSAGVQLLPREDERYPSLLKPLPDSPPLLYARGELSTKFDSYPVAIVGSRDASPYGIEQARRFASALASAGLTIVSGGAMGIDAIAHKAALDAGGRTIVVQGCGLSKVYPREHAALFARASESGAVISELPMETPPVAENFPSRNRIISGMSLGVIVIEAGARSGSLITARIAAEDHGREVMALPGRVDAPGSAGTLELIKSGGAAIVTHPDDVLAILESPARHQHGGTHQHRYAKPEASEPSAGFAEPANESQRAILQALANGESTLEAVVEATGIDAGVVRREVTMLELSGRLKRSGGLLQAR